MPIDVPTKIYVERLAKQAREAMRPLALLSTTVKNRALVAMAERLEADTDSILEANRDDVEAVGKMLEGESNKDRVKAAVERTRLTAEEIASMADGLRAIADLPDPVGEVTQMWQQSDGMQVSRIRVPIGVIGIISELGPAVTANAAAMCLKSGNVCIIRGGAEWLRSGRLITAGLREAAEQTGVPAGALSFIQRPEREAAFELLRLTKFVDAVIPRGGAGLRKAVLEQSRLPVLCHDGGVSTVYVDANADLPLAQNIVVNSKVQKASATNAADTLLVHQSTGRHLLPGLIRRLLDEFKVEVHGCPKTIALTGSQSMTGYQDVKAAVEEDWGQQFLAPTLAVKIVADVDEALEHIARYGPCQTAAIVTRDYATAMRFTREVDAAAVLVNASTRLHEAEPLGLHAEIGVSTMRLHARGPVTLEQLTCQKYVALGTGQLRQPHPVPQAYEDAIMLKRPS
jgi:glutamate-5-semialdehyde dehydrogenase